MKPTLGQTLSEPLRFTQAQVEAFAALTGDENPVHLDAEFAASTPFGRPIVHGMLAAAVFSKLLGTRMPGNGTLYLQQQLEFRKPMYVEVDYTAQLKVLEVNEAKNRAVVETLLLDAEGAAIVRGQAMVKYQD